MTKDGLASRILGTRTGRFSFLAGLSLMAIGCGSDGATTGPNSGFAFGGGNTPQTVAAEPLFAKHLGMDNDGEHVILESLDGTTKGDILVGKTSVTPSGRAEPLTTLAKGEGANVDLKVMTTVGDIALLRRTEFGIMPSIPHIPGVPTPRQLVAEDVVGYSLSNGAKVLSMENDGRMEFNLGYLPGKTGVLLRQLPLTSGPAGIRTYTPSFGVGGTSNFLTTNGLDFAFIVSRTDEEEIQLMAGRESQTRDVVVTTVNSSGRTTVVERFAPSTDILDGNPNAIVYFDGAEVNFYDLRQTVNRPILGTGPLDQVVGLSSSGNSAVLERITVATDLMYVDVPSATIASIDTSTGNFDGWQYARFSNPVVVGNSNVLLNGYGGPHGTSNVLLYTHQGGVSDPVIQEVSGTVDDVKLLGSYDGKAFLFAEVEPTSGGPDEGVLLYFDGGSVRKKATPVFEDRYDDFNQSRQGGHGLLTVEEQSSGDEQLYHLDFDNGAVRLLASGSVGGGIISSDGQQTLYTTLELNQAGTDFEDVLHFRDMNTAHPLEVGRGDRVDPVNVQSDGVVFTAGGTVRKLFGADVSGQAGVFNGTAVQFGYSP